MAALSVHIDAAGQERPQPVGRRTRRAARSRSCELAATPPAEAQALGPVLVGGPAGLGDQHVDDGLLERGGDVRGGDLGVLAHVVDDRRSSGREKEKS